MPGARERIVDAYVGLLGLRGREGVTIKELVSRAGISRQAFYYHFHDLDSLERAVVRDFLTGMVGVSRAAIGDAAPADDLDAVGASALHGWVALCRHLHLRRELARLLVTNGFQQEITQEFLAMSGSALEAVPYTRDDHGRELDPRCMAIVSALNPYYVAYVFACCVEYLVRTDFRDTPEDAARAFYHLFMPRMNP